MAQPHLEVPGTPRQTPKLDMPVYPRTWSIASIFYTGLWVLLILFLGREYVLISQKHTAGSVISWLVRRGLLLSPLQKLNTEAGGALSFRVGWLGFTAICCTNLYILRKRLGVMKNMGRIGPWLDAHIFCGLVGPTLIVFHANFHVGGLVAISFWSMMVSFASGIVGRYFYLQLLQERVELKLTVDRYETGFDSLLARSGAKLDARQLATLKEEAVRFAGGSSALLSGRATPFAALWASVTGDLRLMFKRLPAPAGMRKLRRPLHAYAVARRRLAASNYFRRLMGYWHAFHSPFAVFMYVVSVIHIIAAYIFRVHH